MSYGTHTPAGQAPPEARVPKVKPPAARTYPAWKPAKPLGNAVRLAGYRMQAPGRPVTPAQRRRLRHHGMRDG